MGGHLKESLLTSPRCQPRKRQMTAQGVHKMVFLWPLKRLQEGLHQLQIQKVFWQFDGVQMEGRENESPNQVQSVHCQSSGPVRANDRLLINLTIKDSCRNQS